MTIRFERPVSAAARLSKHVGALSLLIFLAVLVAHRLGKLATPDAAMLALFSMALAGASVVLAGMGLGQLWASGAEGGQKALRALFYAAIPLFCLAAGVITYQNVPKLYDLSTDPVFAPDWLVPPTGEQGWLMARHDVTAQDMDLQLDAYPDIAGRRYDIAMDRVLRAVRKIARRNRIVFTHTENAGDSDRDLESRPLKAQKSVVADAPEQVPLPMPRPYQDELADLIRHNSDVVLQGETKTLVLGLPFDLVIRLREDDADATLVDLRVAARYGPHDLGYGAAIALDYLNALDAELQSSGKS